jgi:hypothetical protein
VTSASRREDWSTILDACCAVQQMYRVPPEPCVVGVADVGVAYAVAVVPCGMADQNEHEGHLLSEARP